MWLPEGGNVVNYYHGAERRGDCTCVLQGPSAEVKRSVLDLLDLSTSFTSIRPPGLGGGRGWWRTREYFPGCSSDRPKVILLQVYSAVLARLRSTQSGLLEGRQYS